MHNVHYIQVTVSHPLSTGMVERAVQMVISTLWKTCYDDRDILRWWSTVLDDLTIDINTHLVKVHGYTPSKILIGFNPVKKHHDIQQLCLITANDWV